jgi:hypothetical protein
MQERSILGNNTTVRAPIRSADHAEVLHLTFPLLIQYLQQHEDGLCDLQMICPWRGVPLPSIELALGSSMNARIKIELSLESSEELIRFVSSGTVTEVPERGGP